MKAFNYYIGYGEMYTLIREKLQQICKNHRMIINNSAAAFVKYNSNFFRANASACEK